jgi:hypothetical protein
VTEHLPSKHKALSSNSRTAKIIIKRNLQKMNDPSNEWANDQNGHFSKKEQMVRNT